MRKSLSCGVDIALANVFATLEIVGRGGGSSDFDGVLDLDGGLTRSEVGVLSLKASS
jgi:hypothetical protein